MSCWFGESWDAPVCDPVLHRPTPVGEPCEYCERLIQEDDRGVIIPTVHHGAREETAWHLACFLETVLGEEVVSGLGLSNFSGS